MIKEELFNYGLDRLQLLSSEDQDYVVGAMTLLRINFNYEDCLVIANSILIALPDLNIEQKYILQGADA